YKCKVKMLAVTCPNFSFKPVFHWCSSCAVCANVEERPFQGRVTTETRRALAPVVAFAFSGFDPQTSACMNRRRLPKFMSSSMPKSQKCAPDAHSKSLDAVCDSHSSSSGTKVTGVITHLR